MTVIEIHLPGSLDRSTLVNRLVTNLGDECPMGSQFDYLRHCNANTVVQVKIEDS